MLFINTRPIDRAQALTQCLSESGFDVVNLPLLELTPRPFNPQFAQLYIELLTTQVVVVVSPTAVQIGVEYLQKAQISLDQLSHIQWIAVGKKTAALLQQHGIQSHVPEVETSEGMLSLPIFNRIKNLKRIAFWRGEGGRQFMMQHCQDRHIDVLNFVLYERACPKATVEQFQQFAMNIQQYTRPFWNCISSEASWNYWLELTQQHERILNDCHYLVLGDRLYQLLLEMKTKNQKCFNISKISNLEPESILQRIEQLQRKL